MVSDDDRIFKVVFQSHRGEGAMGVIWHIVTRPKRDDDARLLTLN
jgi:hypothetical protein